MFKPVEYDFGDKSKKAGFGGRGLGFVEKCLWSREGLKMENCSINVHASARALARLGAFMAQKGQFKGKTLMSE